MEASVNRHELRTTLQNLVVSYKDAEKSKDGSVFICSGNNIVGNTEVQLQVFKRVGERKSKVPLALEKIAPGQDPSNKKKSIKTIFNLHLTVIALFFYWF